jgi:hypothetical protein
MENVKSGSSRRTERVIYIKSTIYKKAMMDYSLRRIPPSTGGRAIF